jgi:hypothetical protein
MSLAAVPDDDERHIAWTPRKGRQVRALESDSESAVAWVTDQAVPHPGRAWLELAKEAATTGLQPFFLSGLDGGTERPWDDGEFGEPEVTSKIDAIDAGQLLRTWWEGQVPEEEEYAEDEELRGILAPFGLRFPGLAPPVEQELDAELTARALHQYTGAARIGLVPADRPSDVLPRLGWLGASNHRDASELAAVLRSWEDRYGARLLDVGFADIRLLVSRPPQTLEAAEQLAAEHYAFSNESARRGLSDIGSITRALVNNPFWDFWWD